MIDKEKRHKRTGLAWLAVSVAASIGYFVADALEWF
jgi:hypothetical protein